MRERQQGGRGWEKGREPEMVCDFWDRKEVRAGTGTGGTCSTSTSVSTDSKQKIRL